MNSSLPCSLLWAALLAAPCLASGVLASEDDLADWVNEGSWRRGPRAVAPTAEKQAIRARKLQDLGDARQAAEQYKRLGDVYTESTEAEEGLVLSAKNFLAAGDLTACRDQLNELRRRYANPTYLDAIGEVEVLLGRSFLEAKGEGGTYRVKSRIRKAVAIFERQYDQDPQGRWADDCLLGLGQCAEVLFDYDTAIKKYKELLEKYPRSELRAEAEGHIAVCINKREPQPEYTESDTREARDRIEQAFKEADADGVNLDVVALKEHEKVLTERQAEKRFQQAMFYLKNRHFRATEVYLELIKDRYPDSPWAVKAGKELELLKRR